METTEYSKWKFKGIFLFSLQVTSVQSSPLELLDLPLWYVHIIRIMTGLIFSHVGQNAALITFLSLMLHIFLKNVLSLTLFALGYFKLLSDGHGDFDLGPQSDGSSRHFHSP